MGYWDGLQRKRINRRVLLRTGLTAGAGAAALGLLACGDDDKGGVGKSETGGSGIVTKPVDSSSKATRGGILPAMINTDTPGFQVYPSSSAALTTHNGRVYSKFFSMTMANRAKGEEPLTTVAGDVFSSFEFSADGLQVTGKLRPDITFDPRPPTNGRRLTTDDIKFSWDKIKTLGKSRGTLSNEVNKGAPIASLTTPDSSTVVIKLAFPSPGLLPNLAFALTGAFIYPTDAEGKFDPAKDMRGSGPWMLERYEPSVSFQYRRNPGFYDKNRPVLDGLDIAIIPDYAQQLAQFRTGRLYTFPIRPEDIVATKKDLPDLLLQQALWSPAITHKVQFNMRPGSQWLDDRLRQALSMTIDRDLITETLNNVEGFRKEGIDMDIRWNTVVGVGDAEFWLDPKGKDFGENAKYFKHDLAEATKLVKATGKDKIEDKWVYPAPPQYGATFQQAIQILANMYNEGPFKLTNDVRDYATDYSKRVIAGSRLTGGHDFEGVADAGVTSFPEIDSFFATHFIPGGTFYSFEEDYPPANDRWFSLLKSQQLEQDRKKRADLIKDFQRYAAGKMYVIPATGQSPTFNLAWPWTADFGTFATRGDSPGTEVTLWLDKSRMKS
ncbi:MAG TPA: ABC transporter substrate-binding protein [Dehalococcoidia bacterium]|nr:ABC transporter substrate-binding protein [Dehalococcoidia bacterium]